MVDENVYTIFARDAKHLDELLSLVHSEGARYRGEIVKSVKILPPNSEFTEVEITTYSNEHPAN